MKQGSGNAIPAIEELIVADPGKSDISNFNDQVLLNANKKTFV